ncbi:MAG TPA: hypothetical protein VK671_07010 [Mucilaginibacter sp.]|nr:hypothetical protein [Mucilaginibacter sp.]
MNYITIKQDLEIRTCPLHNIRPLVRFENGKIMLRCCCDYFTRKCMDELDQKLQGKNMMNSIIDAWEQDLANQGRQVA